MLSRPTILRMCVYGLFATFVVAVWTFGVWNADTLPFWLILTICGFAFFVLPAIENPRRLTTGGIRPQGYPTFPVWLLGTIGGAAMFGGMFVMAVASGWIAGEPVALNIGVRTGLLISALGANGMSLAALVSARDHPSRRRG